MIGRVAGRVVHRGLDHVVIDAGGVGYVVHVSERTLAGMPGVGQAAALWTDLLVREDLLQLFGFATLQEKEWHRLLLSVQGIGARASLAILGALGPEGVGRAIALGDSAAIRAAPGVGPKIAARVVNELRDKAAVVMTMPAAPEMPLPTAAAVEVVTAPEGAMPATPPPPIRANSAQPEAMSALVNLGYGPPEAARAVAEAAEATPGAETPALIRAALRLLAPKG